MLASCEDLTEAELHLRRITPALTRAQMWGLWDGWTGRPVTESGLSRSSRKPSELSRLDYFEAVEIGRELSTRNSPS